MFKYERRVIEVKHGAIVIATGADEYKPDGYLYTSEEVDRLVNEAPSYHIDPQRCKTSPFYKSTRS